MNILNNLSLKIDNVAKQTARFLKFQAEKNRTVDYKWYSSIDFRKLIPENTSTLKKQEKTSQMEELISNEVYANVTMDNLCEHVRVRIFNEINLVELSDDALGVKIHDILHETVQKYNIMCSEEKAHQLSNIIFSSIRGLDILDSLMQEDDITEIIVNGTGQIYYTKNSERCLWQKSFNNDEQLLAIIQKIVSMSGREINLANPLCQTILKYEWDVIAIIPPIAVDGAILKMKRLSKSASNLDDFVSKGLMTKELADLLKDLVQSHHNILIGGNDENEKNNLLNCLIDYIPKEDIVVAIQNHYKIYNSCQGNILKLATRSGGPTTDISCRDLIKTARGLKSDCLIINGIWTGDLLDAVQSNYYGTKMLITTLRGYSSQDLLEKCEFSIQMNADIPLNTIKNQLSDIADIIIIVSDDGKILEVSQVLGVSDENYNINTIYKTMHRFDTGNAIRTSNRLIDKHGKLQIAGLSSYLEKEFDYKYDVFISYKSVDEVIAKELSKYLSSCGVKVFLSCETLPQIGNDAYIDSIFEALDQSHHMIILASDVKHLHSKWVKEEWNYFLGEIREGRKEGNVILVLDDSIQVEKKFFPPQLRHKEIVKLSEIKDKLLSFVKVY